MIRRFVILFALVAVALVSVAQDMKWDVRIEGDGTASPSVVLTASVPQGAHLYAQDNPSGGANPLEITVTPEEGCELVGTPVPSKTATTAFDESFNQNQKFYTGKVSFTQKLRPTAGSFKVKVKVRGQYCTDKACVPTRLNKELSGTGIPAATEQAKVPDTKLADKTVGEGVADAKAPADADAADADSLVRSEMESFTNVTDSAASASAAGINSDTWANVQPQLKELQAKSGHTSSSASRSLLAIFIAGFLAGFLALLTPCVWPMIPMTVSFFLKQNKSRKRSVGMASLYGLSIIVIYVAIGVIVTAIFGATALNTMATSAVFNIIFFVILVVFAISFLGGFELTLPAKWTNRIDEKADTTTGLLSIFFMAFTLSLVSFSCTGPIIGTLLVEAAASGSIVSPAIGMFGFALALAIPFTLFAIFPSWLKSMPKSGGWLNSVKVVLGFLELALALKFLSVADMAYHWRILDREVFIALWIVIFALLGVYLLGKLRLPHDSERGKTGVLGLMLSLVCFAFSVYMLPGLWGAPLKAISAFAPPSSTQDFNLYDKEVSPDVDDYDAALALGARENKPILVDFSGHGCVNCRKMEGAVWTDDEVRDMLRDDFVLTTLYVDDRKSLPSPVTMKNNKGEEVELENYGDLWSFLQENKFGAAAQPYHVILDPTGKPLTYPQDFTDNPEEYKKFLRSALEAKN